MRVIAIEEHFSTEDLLASGTNTPPPPIRAKLVDVGDARIADMDAAGIDMQVLSPNAPSVQVLEPALAVEVARRTNDRLAEIVAAHPDRFAGFATVPTPDPAGAVVELERSIKELGLKGAIVHGHSRGHFLDDKRFWPVLECAEDLGVPIYLHPAPPPEAVMIAYFSGLDEEVGRALSTSAWGWHVETGMHALRLVVAGVFDRFPRLQIMLGHMGENIPFSLARADSTLGRVTRHLERPVADYFHENFYITTSGYITFPPLLCALLVFGADRLMFSVDFPFADNKSATEFLAAAPISPPDRHKIAHGNVERLLHL